MGKIEAVMARCVAQPYSWRADPADVPVLRWLRRRYGRIHGWRLCIPLRVWLAYARRCSEGADSPPAWVREVAAMSTPRQPPPQWPPERRGDAITYAESLKKFRPHTRPTALEVMMHSCILSGTTDSIWCMVGHMRGGAPGPVYVPARVWTSCDWGATTPLAVLRRLRSRYRGEPAERLYMPIRLWLAYARRQPLAVLYAAQSGSALAMELVAMLDAEASRRAILDIARAARSGAQSATPTPA